MVMQYIQHWEWFVRQVIKVENTAGLLQSLYRSVVWASLPLVRSVDLHLICPGYG
jgi:hypothetical protein